MQSSNAVQIVPVQNVLPVGQGPLTPGSSLFVRVINVNGDGSYLVSAGGNRMNVHSQNPLSVGQTFVVLVGTNDAGDVVFEPAVEKSVPQSRSPDSLQSFLYSNGIEAGDSAFRVLQFMVQTGLKIDRSLMEKSLVLGRKFKGKEKLASEATAILLQKGISPTDENILALMSYSVGEYGGDRQRKGRDENGGQSQNFIDSLYPAGTGKGTGLLTYMNHVANGNRHWVFLPYEWTMGKENARGCIRILINLDTKESEKILLNCELNSTKYYFVLYCTKSKGKEVRFFTLPPLLPSKIRTEELRLGGFLCSGMSLGEPVTVTYSDSACSDGLCTVDESPSMIETQA